jgi:hypothetical protein
MILYILHTFRVHIYTLPSVTSNGFDTYFISKLDRLSIHSSFLLGPRHHIIPQNQLNSFLAERKQIADRRFFYRMRLKKPSFRRTDFSPSWTHKSDSLPNFGVNTLYLPFKDGTDSCAYVTIISHLDEVPVVVSIQMSFLMNYLVCHQIEMSSL